MTPSANFTTNEEIKEARENLLWASELSWNYVIMNGLAATIATYGLFANSPAVVIGAMVVAMLLGPISSLALGIIDSDRRLLAKSLVTLVCGVFVVCITASFLGWVHISSPITAEIMARTAPNFMDLMIALAGGVAGALSLVHKRLTTAFVGVAIATALVPPLSSASILLVRGEFVLSQGAFLLTFTNIIGIQFGYALVLWLKNINAAKRNNHSIVSFAKQNSIGLGIMIVLAIFFVHNLNSVVSKFNFENNVRIALSKEIETIPGSNIVGISFSKENGELIIRTVVRGPNAPDKNAIAVWEKSIPANYFGIPNELRIRFVKTNVLTKNGELYSDIEN